MKRRERPSDFVPKSESLSGRGSKAERATGCGVGGRGTERVSAVRRPDKPSYGRYAAPLEAASGQATTTIRRFGRRTTGALLRATRAVPAKEAVA